MKLIEEMKALGIFFLEGITDEQLQAVEQLYGIVFPESLKQFYRLGLPVSSGFTDWLDLNEENVQHVRRKLAFPLRSVRMAVEMGELWAESWGERPEDEEEAADLAEKQLSEAVPLIPIYGHRYMPLISGMDDPPVLSIYGEDIICYGQNLGQWIAIEFLGVSQKEARMAPLPQIPGWDELIG